MNKVCEFKKGEVIPQWLESTEKFDGVFGTNVEVYNNDEGYHVFPFQQMNFENDQCIMYFTPRKEATGAMDIQGAPTTIYSQPYKMINVEVNKIQDFKENNLNINGENNVIMSGK